MTAKTVTLTDAQRATYAAGDAAWNYLLRTEDTKAQKDALAAGVTLAYELSTAHGQRASAKALGVSSSKFGRHANTGEILALLPKVDVLTIARAINTVGVEECRKVAKGDPKTASATLRDMADEHNKKTRKARTAGDPEKPSKGSKTDTEEKPSKTPIGRTATAQDVIAFIKASTWTAEEFRAVEQAARVMAQHKEQGAASVAQVS